MTSLTRLSSFVLLLMVANLLMPASAQVKADIKVDNDPFKYAAYTGRMMCEGKVVVTVLEDKKHPNHFDVAIGKKHYKTIRVATDSGAIRLEDQAHGIVWLQMSNKSMLFNEKEGKRLANNCRNDAQTAAEKALTTSTAPSVLDATTPVKP
jgi:hypothetical protein